MTPHVHVGQPNSASFVYSCIATGLQAKKSELTLISTIYVFLSFIRSISEKEISKSFILKGFLDTQF